MEEECPNLWKFRRNVNASVCVQWQEEEEQGLSPGQIWYPDRKDGDAGGVKVGTWAFYVGHRDPPEPDHAFIFNRLS